MTKQQAPVIPDLMDGLIQAPALEQEIAKLGAWLLNQEVPALHDLPVSALGSLAGYVRNRIHEDRCERFVQDSQDREQEKFEKKTYLPDPEEDAVRTMLSPRPAPSLPVPVGGLETMWQQAPEAKPVPEIDIPRPAV